MNTRNRLAWRGGLIACGLLTTVAGMAQQNPLPLPPPIEALLQLSPPAAPSLLRPEEKFLRGLDGQNLPLPSGRTTAHTRPELARLPVPQPSEIFNKALGDQGVRVGDPIVLPFGSKGETAGIAFHTGFYAPPPGEKIQPALWRLAQNRAAQQNNLPGHAAVEEASVYALLLLNGRLMNDLKMRLEALGVEIVAPYPSTAWQARIPARALQAVAGLPEVRWIGQPDVSQKLHRDLWADAAAARRAASEQSLYVALFAPDSTGGIRETIRQAGGKINLYDASIQVVQVDATPAAMLRMANLDSVLFIEPVPIFQAHDTQSMSAINADWLWGNFAPSNTNKVRVGILDSGLDILHTDFANIHGGSAGYNWIAGENWWNDGAQHGTHVAGTFFGAGRGQGRYRGVAANLTTRGSFNDPDLVVARVLGNNNSSVGNSVFEGLQAVNGEFRAVDRVQIFNASLGANGTNLVGTDTNSRKVDELVRNNIVAVFSAGNAGPGAGTIGAPGVAKNALTVGSINDSFAPTGFVGWPGNNDNIAVYSSRGPTGDSRTKPDVVAPGSWIDSVDAGTASGYLFDWTGTSMAAPHVAGLAAGIIGHFNMPAWATKAAIIASAYETGLGRNNAGWGKVDAMMAHYSIDGGWSGWWWTNGATGDTRYVDFTLSASASRVRIVLTWPDPVAAAGATVSTVNDVDLGLQWGTLTTNWTANLTSSSSRQTVEVIDANNLAAGTYRIKVHSYNVSGSQPVAVVMKVIHGSLSPNINMTLDTPYAVQPNSSFYAKAHSQAGSHVASSVYGSIGLASGLSLEGLWYNRRGNPSSGEEWVWFPNPRDTSQGYYSPFEMNQGSIAAGYTRSFWWQVRAGGAEGTRAVNYSVSSRNGGSGSVSRNVIVDGTPPFTDVPYLWYWTSGFNATTYCWTYDVLAGLNVGLGYYNYSTNGGATWSGWLSTPCTGSNGATGWEYMYSENIPFGKNSITDNLIIYAIADMAGNWSYSPINSVWSYAVLNGNITLEGPGSMAHPITFEFRPLDGGATFTRTVTPDAAGNYTLSLLEPRHYTAHIKGSRWLAKNRTINLTMGDVALSGVLLPAGDANDDNSVDVLDLDLLIQSFDLCSGDPGYIEGADFNDDGCVDVLDLDLLIRNFDQTGDP